MTSSPRRTRVLVVTPLGQGGQGGIDRIMDEVRHRLREDRPADLDVSFATTRGQGHIGLSIPLVLSVVLRTAARLIGAGPDVAHVNLSTQGSTLRKLVVTRAMRLVGVPYVLHLHGSGFDQYWERTSATLSRAIAGMFAGATRVIVLGTFWRDVVATRVPEAEAKIDLLPNATPAPAADRAAEPEGPITILFLGHVGPRKGVPQLVEALSGLSREAEWRAVIAGNGEVEATRAALAQAGLSDRVTLTGWVGPADVHALLASAHVLVLPSFEENLPMSVIEGMAHGLAIVTTPVGAVTDIIEDERTGLLVPPGDVGRLRDALARLIGDSDLRRTLGRHARDFHRAHLDIEGYTDRLVAIWRMAAAA